MGYIYISCLASFGTAINPFRRLSDLSVPGWNAFVTLMKNESDGDWGCSDARAVSKFFKDSCVLGWNNRNSGTVLPANLHSLCKKGETSRTRARLSARPLVNEL